MTDRIDDEPADWRSTPGVCLGHLRVLLADGRAYTCTADVLVGPDGELDVLATSEPEWVTPEARP